MNNYGLKTIKRVGRHIQKSAAATMYRAWERKHQQLRTSKGSQAVLREQRQKRKEHATHA